MFEGMKREETTNGLDLGILLFWNLLNKSNICCLYLTRGVNHGTLVEMSHKSYLLKLDQKNR
jgi:hypothetical protein